MIEPLTFEDLAEDYPKVFQAGRPRCGMGVGRGWEALVRELCQAIEDLLPAESDFKVAQIKEKFGGLRFYTEPNTLPEDTNRNIARLIFLVECRSFGACEVCGKPGKSEPGGSRYGWVKTLCVEHMEERSRGYGPDNTRKPVPTEDIELK